MKYSKKQIMKRAWNLYNKSKLWVASCHKTFGQCLHQAWEEAKTHAAAIAKVVTGAGRNVNGCIVFVRKAVIAEAGRMGWYLDGKTYPIRKEIKRAGFRWDVEARGWYTEDIEVVANFLA